MANPRHGLVAILATAVLAATGCAIFGIETGPGAPEGFEEEVPEAPEPAEGESVPLEIVEAALDGVLALVPVTIAGEGPYSFVLDTGATNSTIDAALVDELGLEETGTEGGVAGVTGETTGVAVRVDSWRLGEVELDAQELVSLDLRRDGAGLDVDGLLGSDVLAGFGTVTIDYDAGVLVLDVD